jgi:ABC-type Zn2+ transport system substrate-binding protein/surface adhesin
MKNMKTMKNMNELLGVSCCALALAVFAGCEKKDAAAPAAKAGDHSHDGDHAHDHDHDHDHAEGDKPMKDDGHGETVQLGEQKAGPYTVKVSRDGEIKAGGDVPVDIWVDGGAKGKSVRFWFGAEDAKGSIKAKCEVEDGHWHTHGEVPDPMPEGSKLWIEIEGEDGTKTLVGFAI